jgi:hypothetical protein
MRMNYIVRPLFVALFLLAVSATSFAQVSIGISVGFAPPPLPVYEQPICPAEGYIWTPGYWAWDEDDGDYYWVPGTWVMAPEIGYLWTPAYWGWGGNGFFYHEGYWGPQVGFYGGINYGYGYLGHGYEGGRWDGDRFYYNRSVNNVNVTEIHNVYNTTIVNNNTTVNRVSYNGGNGGVNERPTAREEAAARERHVPPVAPQMQHVQAARANRDLRASVNQGKPPIAATPKPAAFTGRGVVPARQAGGHYSPPPQANRGGNKGVGNTGDRNNGGTNAGVNNANRPPVHPNEVPAYQRPPAPHTGNPKVDQKYQQQQDKMYSKQEQDRQKLQQKQEQEHQRLAQQKADDARKQQVEQRHQQQTQQMQQRHEQQQQHMQQKQLPPPPPPRESRPPGRP